MDNIDITIQDIINRSSTIIKDESFFDSSYVPNELVHRENEIKYLANYFKTILNTNQHNSRVLIIQGEVGTGKTSVAKSFGRKFEELTSKPNLKSITFIYFNARQVKSWYMLFSSLLRRLIPNFPLRGYSSNELLIFLSRILKDKRINLLLCLDEIDFLLQSKADESMLYTLMRINENTSNTSHISLILISRSFEFLYSLDTSICSTLTQNILSFKKYEEDELFTLLKKRAIYALNENTFSDNTLSEIAKISAKKGDARYAIELLWRAAKIAEKGKNLYISKIDINEAQLNILPIDQSIIVDLNFQLKMVLYSLVKTLFSKPTTNRMSSKELKTSYSATCRRWKITPRGKTQFWEYLQNLAHLGLIKMEVKNEHTRKGKSLGRKTIVWMEELALSSIMSILENDFKTSL